MSNTSASGGYLAPAPPPPSGDTALDEQLQAMVVGIVGMNGTLVRPRWQPDLPPEPPVATNWCAIGVLTITPNANVAIVHHPDGDGYDVAQRHEDIQVLASFYGPGAWGNASLFRDGLAIPQNREAMFLEGLVYVETGEIVNAPSIVNNVWQRRVDISFHLRREVDRTYAVLNLLEAQGSIVTDEGSVQGQEASRVIPWQAGPNPPLP